MPKRYSFIVRKPEEAKAKIQDTAVEKIEGWLIKRKKYVCAPINVITETVEGEFGVIKVDLANPKEAGGFFADVLGIGTKGWLPQAEGEASIGDIQTWLSLARQNLGRYYIYDEAGDMSVNTAREILQEQGFIPKPVPKPQTVTQPTVIQSAPVSQTVAQPTVIQSAPVSQTMAQPIVTYDSAVVQQPQVVYVASNDGKNTDKSFMEKYGLYIILAILIITIIIVARR